MKDRSRSRTRSGESPRPPFLSEVVKQPKNVPALSRAVFSNQYGTVRVYTRRHINGCTFTLPDQQHCSCPKWIYSKARDGKAARRAATTPSFTEACDQAQKLLKGLDPEIRAARQTNTPVLGPTIQEALDRYFSALASRKLSPDYISAVHSYFYRRHPQQPGRPALNSSLLDFLDCVNATAFDPILRLEQISPALLDDWAASWKGNDLSCKGWRNAAKSFFKWAVGRNLLDRAPQFGERQKIKKGNRCGFFNDEQYAKLRATLAFAVPANISSAGRRHYIERLGAFLDLGRWAGLAVIDIVRFSPRISLGANDVLTYRRAKNGEIATILLSPEIARRLRSIPAEPGSSAEQPFRFPPATEKANGFRWRNRFHTLCLKAGITEAETEIGTVREPHPHMLRDTFAIDAITRGVSLENVAKMLGHASVEMTQRAYLFWVKKRLDYCIEDQRKALARRVDVAAAAEAAGGETAAALRRTFVH